jgi:hypothetical protein
MMATNFPHQPAFDFIVCIDEYSTVSSKLQDVDRAAEMQDHRRTRAVTP